MTTELKMTAAEWAAYQEPFSIITDYTAMCIIIGLFLFLIIAAQCVGKWGKEYQKYGSKKFAVAIAMATSAFMLTWLGKMSGGSAAFIFSVVAAGYGALNIMAQKHYDPEAIENDTKLSRKLFLAMLTMAFTMVLGCYDEMSGGSLVAPLLTAGGMFGISNEWSKKQIAKLSNEGKVSE